MTTKSLKKSCAGVDISHLQADFGSKDKFRGMKYFGCCVWFRLPSNHDPRPKSISFQSAFLWLSSGYNIEKRLL